MTTSIALLAGILSLIGSFICWGTPSFHLEPWFFLKIWTTTFIIVILARDSTLGKKEKPPQEKSSFFNCFFVPWFPTFLAGVFLTFWLMLTPDTLALTLLWNTFYGLALLSEPRFTPLRLLILGWAFLLTGLSTALLYFFLPFDPFFFSQLAIILMGMSFGLYHLIYAASKELMI